MRQANQFFDFGERHKFSSPPLPLASLVYEIFHKTGVAYRGTLSNFISTQIFVFLVILSLYLHRYKHWRMMARLSPSENTCGMLHRTCKLYRSAHRAPGSFRLIVYFNICEVPLSPTSIEVLLLRL